MIKYIYLYMVKIYLLRINLFDTLSTLSWSFILTSWRHLVNEWPWSILLTLCLHQFLVYTFHISYRKWGWKLCLLWPNICYHLFAISSFFLQRLYPCINRNFVNYNQKFTVDEFFISVRVLLYPEFL